MKITFIRHSKTVKDPQVSIRQWVLSDEGVERAQEISTLNVVRNIDVLYSSLQNKALETAVIMAKPHNTPIKVDDSLTEISSFTQKFFGKEIYEENVSKFFSGEIERIEGGETAQEALERFSRALENIVIREDKNNITNIGVVSHGTILSYFCSQFSEYSALEIHKMISMPDIAVFDWEKEKFDVFFGELV